MALASSVAQAEAAEPVRLRYEAPPECPTESAFIERVRERTTHLELATATDLARSLTVTLGVDASGVLGRVDFVGSDGARVSRVVRGESCDEVASGLALVTALALEAAPNDAGSHPPPVEVAAPPAPVASEPTAPSKPPETVSPPAEAGAHGTAGFGVGYVGWAGPHGGLSLDAFFAWAFRSEGPAVRLSAWHWRASDDTAGREATFLGWGGRLEGCPWTFAQGPLFAEPCLGTNLGLLRAKGIEGPGVSRSETASLFWRDLLVVGRLGARLGRFVVVEAQGDLEFPLFRHRFGFNDANGAPTGTVYEVPVVSGGAEVHVGVRFP